MRQDITDFDIPVPVQPSAGGVVALRATDILKAVMSASQVDLSAEAGDICRLIQSECVFCHFDT